MTIYDIHQLAKMLESLDERTETGEKRWIYDWCFLEDGRTIYIELSNHERYYFNIDN